MTPPSLPQLGPFQPGQPAYPRVLNISEAFSSAIAVLRARIGLFLGLGFAQVGAVLALVSVWFVVLFATLMPVVSSSWGLSPAFGEIAMLIAINTVTWLVMVVAMMLVQIKLNAMIVLLARRTGEGAQPTWSELSQGTRGVIGRTVPVYLALGAAGLVLGGLWIGAWVLAVGAGDAALGGTIFFSIVLYLALLVGALVLTVRWLYFTQEIVLEGQRGFDALRRSWRLTAGEFWRTLGWYLAVSLVVVVASMLVSSVSGLASPSDSNALFDPFTSLAAVWVSFALSMIVQALGTPAILTYVTVMHADQKTRSGLRAAGIDPARMTAGYQQPYPGFNGGTPAGYAAPPAGFAGNSGVGFPGGPVGPAAGAGPAPTPGWAPPTAAAPGGYPGGPSATPSYGAPAPGGYPPPGVPTPPSAGSPTGPGATPSSGPGAPYGPDAPYGATAPYGSAGSAAPYGPDAAPSGPTADPYGSPPQPGWAAPEDPSGNPGFQRPQQ